VADGIARTDRDGRYTVAVPDAAGYDMTATVKGYQTRELHLAPGTAPANLSLKTSTERAPTVDAPMDATAVCLLAGLCVGAAMAQAVRRGK
jgi:hypothetical protein